MAWYATDLIRSHSVKATRHIVNSYAVVIQHREDIGTPWVVRTYKKTLLCKRLVSSDWFLDGEQAQLFARQLKTELEGGPDLIRNRKPGWTLRRPAH